MGNSLRETYIHEEGLSLSLYDSKVILVCNNLGKTYCVTETGKYGSVYLE